MSQDNLDGSETTQDRNLTSGDEAVGGSVDYEMSESPPALHSMASQTQNFRSYLPPLLRLPPELLSHIFGLLDITEDQWAFALSCKTLFNLSIDGLWLRPSIQRTEVFLLLLRTLMTDPKDLYAPYPSMIKRLNLTAIAEFVTDALILRTQACRNLERLTLSGCSLVSNTAMEIIVGYNPNLQSIDMSGMSYVGDKTLFALAQNCKKLQGLYAANCTRITDLGVKELVKNCPYLKRVKLTNCREVDSSAIDLLTTKTTGIVELDLAGCVMVNDDNVTNILSLGLLRELHLASINNITDAAFLRLSPDLLLDRLRVIDLASCSLITDASIAKLVQIAPRLRNVVLAKCVNITDRGVEHLSRLEKSLHHLHLGHCTNVTDMGISLLVRNCSRIEYIDLACCTELTNIAVKDLSTLPGLRRIGLVKCTQIDDEAIDALSERPWSNTLERVHLSYCNRISLGAIKRLLNSCQNLTHLSLTGVSPFIRTDLTRFCRPPPPDFTQHQQSMFCVFSGRGVESLRIHLNMESVDEEVTNDTSAEATAATTNTNNGMMESNNQILRNNNNLLVVGEEMEDVPVDDTNIAADASPVAMPRNNTEQMEVVQDGTLDERIPLNANIDEMGEVSS